MLSYAYTIAELNPSFFDEFTDSYYGKIRELIQELE